MEDKDSCGNIACIMGSLSQRAEIVCKLFGMAFGDEALLQVLIFALDESQEVQIQSLLDFHEDDSISECKPESLKSEIWDLLCLDRETYTHSFLMARVSTMLGALLSMECEYYLGRNELHLALLAYDQSGMMIGMAMALGGTHLAKDSVSSNARRAGAARLANDPKQKDKLTVRECWDDWQKQPDRYKGKAAFARDMRDKFPNLESQPVIERWCREWETQNITQQAG